MNEGCSNDANGNLACEIYFTNSKTDLFSAQAWNI
jgi:hypothetical protein